MKSADDGIFFSKDRQLENDIFAIKGTRIGENRQRTVTEMHSAQLYLVAASLEMPANASSQNTELSCAFGHATLRLGGQVMEHLSGPFNEFLIAKAAQERLNWCSKVFSLLRHVGLAKLVVDTVLSFCILDDVNVAALLLFKSSFRSTAVFAELYCAHRSSLCIPIYFSVSKSKPFYKPPFQTLVVECDDIKVSNATLESKMLIGNFVKNDDFDEERYTWTAGDNLFSENNSLFQHRQATRISAMVIQFTFDKPLPADVDKLFDSIDVYWADGNGFQMYEHDSCFDRRTGSHFWFVVRRDGGTLFEEQPNEMEKMRRLLADHTSDNDTILQALRRHRFPRVCFAFNNLLANESGMRASVWAKDVNIFHHSCGVACWYWQI